MNDKQFLVEDYKLKIDYLNAHFGRMWTRFNYFVTIQSGLIGFLLISENAGLSRAALIFVLAEIALSVLWWVFGAQDRALVTIYRDAVMIAAKRIANEKELVTEPDKYDYGDHWVGNTETNPANSNLDWRSPIEWRYFPISITKLAAYVPLLALATWLAFAILILLWPEIGQPIRDNRSLLTFILLPILVVAFLWVVVLLIWAFLKSRRSANMNENREQPDTPAGAVGAGIEQVSEE